MNGGLSLCQHYCGRADIGGCNIRLAKKVLLAAFMPRGMIGRMAAVLRMGRHQQMKDLPCNTIPLGYLWDPRHEWWDHLGLAVMWLHQWWRLQPLAGVESLLGCLWTSSYERWDHFGSAVLQFDSTTAVATSGWRRKSSWLHLGPAV